jgi:hypothetical protein
MSFKTHGIEPPREMEFTTTELAERCGLHPSRIRQLAQEIIAAGYGRKIGVFNVFSKCAVEYVLNRPDGRSTVDLSDAAD